MILSLEKVTLYGLMEDKDRVLTDLQQLGCLHVIPLTTTRDPAASGPSSDSRDALQFLLTCPNRRHQVHDPDKFHAEQVESRALEIKHRIHLLTDERDFLIRRIRDLRPWGDFSYPAPDELGGLRLWFYVVPNQLKRKIPATGLAWEIVGQDSRFSRVAVVSRDEPQGMPVPRTHTGDKPLAELEQRLEEVELELEDLQAVRAGLTRWCTLFANTLYRLEDGAERRAVAQRTLDEDPLFALQAWTPENRLPALRSYARESALVLDVTDPDPGEIPPTLLRNPPRLQAGQDLVSFYMTPGYWVWDPSEMVFFSFALFFGIILGDAGYGLLLGAALLLGWRSMGRSSLGSRLRILFAFLSGSTLIWGVLLGNYFGLELPGGSFLKRLQVLDLQNFSSMMKLVILLGAGHLILGNAVLAWRRRRSPRALASAGWVLLFLGALAVWLQTTGTGIPGVWKTAGFSAMGLGALCVLLFSSPEERFGKRLLGGLQGLTGLSAAFGDTLSYLRLFALLLASASLATTFNDLAANVYTGSREFGLLFALIILVLGHGLNILLGVTGGFIHGLRLNFIEFFKWATPEEGTPFRVFARKEKSTWKP
jgi:V/A-type H+/Na+-transporting ATPase subunit I